MGSNIAEATITKTEGDTSYPASAYLVATDPKTVTTWHLRVRDAEGKADHGLMGAAWASLHEGYRGNKYEGPGAAEALTALKALYQSEDMPLPGEKEDAPEDEEAEPKEAEPLDGILGRLREADLDDLSRPELEGLVTAMAREGLFESYVLHCDTCLHTYATHLAEAAQIAACPFCGEPLSETQIAELATVHDSTHGPVVGLTEFEGSMDDKIAQVRAEYNRQNRPADTLMPSEVAGIDHGWVQDVFMDDPALGTVVIVERRGVSYALPFTENPNGGITFAPWVDAKQVTRVWKLLQSEPKAAEPKEAEAPIPAGGTPAITILSEAGEDAELREPIRITEAEDVTTDGNRRGPVKLTVAFIRPGWGNKRDNYYYSAEMLRENAGKFKGAKMFMTQHKEHTAQNHVAFIKDVVGFAEDGSPLGETVVFDPDLAERVRNLHDADALDQLEVSIFATGAKKPAVIDGRKGFLVEEIHADPKPIVDFVAYGAAGGRAVGLREADDTREVLTKDAVRAILARSNAQAAVATRLLEREFATEAELQEALSAERTYLATALGSGRPVGLGESSSPRRGVDRAQLAAKLNEVDEKFGLLPATRLEE